MQDSIPPKEHSIVSRRHRAHPGREICVCVPKSESGSDQRLSGRALGIVSATVPGTVHTCEHFTVVTMILSRYYDSANVPHRREQHR